MNTSFYSDISMTVMKNKPVFRCLWQAELEQLTAEIQLDSHCSSNMRYADFATFGKWVVCTHLSGYKWVYIKGN